MEIHLKIIGVLLIVLALVHVFFPKYFQWRKQLISLSLINRQMMIVHTFFIAFTVFLMGLLCVTSSEEIVNTSLGKKIAIGLAIFWTVRFFIQLFVYSPQLWKGKRFETFMHFLFSILWIYISVIFWMVYLN